MNIINITIFIIILNFTACTRRPLVLVAEEGKYKDYTYTVPFDISAKSRKETLTDLGIIYQGMPAKDLQLYGFGEKELIVAYTRGNNRYLVFPKRNDLNKVIIFIVRENKVIDWFEDDAKLIN